jgi:hypothetical protein
MMWPSPQMDRWGRGGVGVRGRGGGGPYRGGGVGE